MKLIVSPSSFIGRHVLPALEGGWYGARSSEIRSIDFRGVSEVLVAGADPAIHSSNFDLENSAEVMIAKQLKASGSPGRLIMLSSRMVYGQDEFCRIGRIPVPSTIYGSNKLKLERRITEILGQGNCLILRCSNIFGYEVGRSTFMGTMCTDLLDGGVIHLKINGAVRKDFFPVGSFALALDRVIKAGLTGTHNFGAGCSVSIGDIATNLIGGFGGGRIRAEGTEVAGQFSMSIESLTQSASCIERLTEEQVLTAVQRVGQQLAANSRGLGLQGSGSN